MKDISKISLYPLATLPIHFLFTLLDFQPAPWFPVTILMYFLPAGVTVGEEVLYFNCSKFTTSKLQVVSLRSDDLELPNHLCSLPALAAPHQHTGQMLCPAWRSGSSSLWLPSSLTSPCTPCWFTLPALPPLVLACAFSTQQLEGSFRNRNHVTMLFKPRGKTYGPIYL